MINVNGMCMYSLYASLLTSAYQMIDNTENSYKKVIGSKNTNLTQRHCIFVIMFVLFYIFLK